MANENPTSRVERERNLRLLQKCQTVGDLFREVFGRPMYYMPYLNVDESLMKLPLDSGCGEACARTLLACREFVQNGLPDMELTRVKKNLADAVIAQLETYHLG